MIPTTTLAYAAGILDGEGHIYMPKARRSLYVDVPNTDERLIDWLVETFGGSKIINLDARPNRKTLYRWRAYKKDATAFLLAVTPYLVLKRDLAIEAVR